MDSHGMKGAAFMQQIRRLCILRTAYCRANGCTCIMHFLVTIDFSRIRKVSGKARSYTTYRAKTYCNRDRFVAIKHGMQTPYANVVSYNHEIVSL